jgi:hypothetical protein
MDASRTVPYQPETEAIEPTDFARRCAICGNLRTATPKHLPDCRLAYRNCPGCVDPLSHSHLKECWLSVAPDALARDAEPGVDIPGHGVQPYVYPPAQTGSAPGLHVAVKPAPQPLSDYLKWNPAETVDKAFEATRAALLGQLLFAAKDLAAQSIFPMRTSTEPVWRCRECGRAVIGCGELKHRNTCRVGRVMEVIFRLTELSAGEAVSAIGKEGAAPVAEGDGRAGDGKSPREGLDGVPVGISGPDSERDWECDNCGETGGTSWELERLGVPADMAPPPGRLEANQFLLPRAGEWFLFTHRCAAGHGEGGAR